MNCPKCAGLLIQEEIQVYSGRFQGWRCVQCGLRLDETIVQNRVDGATPDDRRGELGDPPAVPVSPVRASRQKRPAAKH
jgi:hypothetical protein